MIGGNSPAGLAAATDPASHLGLTVPEIARGLLQSGAAVVHRITRAKNKIRQANTPLRVPQAEALPERTGNVLGCIGSVYTEGYWSTAGLPAIRDELCDEPSASASSLGI